MFIMMTSKTLLRKYLRDCTPKEFLERQYVTVSLSIRCTDTFKKHCVSIRALYPNGYAVSDYMTVKSKENYKAFKQDYRGQLKKHEYVIGTLVEAMYTGHYDIVFICNQTENQMHFFDILGDFIQKRFGVPCVWYKDYRKGKAKELSKEDQKEALKRAHVAQYESAREEFTNKFNGNQRFRIGAIENLSMDDKITLLKTLGLYEKGMSKKEIKEILEEKFS